MRPPRAAARTTHVTAILIAFGVIRSCREICPLRILRADASEHARDGRDREPDHVRPRTLDPVDEAGRAALNRVGAGLPLRLPRAHIPVDFVHGDGQEVYP